MSEPLKKLESRGETAARFSALVGILILVALALATIADVLMRWLFNNPIDGMADVAPLMVALSISAIFPYALATRQHITIDFLGGLVGSRGRAWLKVFSAVITGIFFLLLAWQFVSYANNLNEVGQTTWVIRMPVAPWWAVVSAFLCLCVVIQSIIIIVDVGRLVKALPSEHTGDEPAKPPADG